MLVSIFVLTFAFLFLYFLFLLQYIFVCAKRQNVCVLFYCLLCALKKQKACVLFVIFGVDCLCTVCYFILCAEQQNVCVLRVIFCVDGCLVFALLFQRRGIKFKNSLF